MYPWENVKSTRTSHPHAVRDPETVQIETDMSACCAAHRVVLWRVWREHGPLVVYEHGADDLGLWARAPALRASSESCGWRTRWTAGHSWWRSVNE